MCRSLSTDPTQIFKPIFQVKSGNEVSLTLIINDQTLEVRLIGNIADQVQVQVQVLVLP